MFSKEGFLIKAVTLSSLLNYVLCISETEMYSEPLHRTRRQLLFPNSTVLQFNAGVGTPSPARNINVNWAFQANFQLPWNRSQIPFDILEANSGYDGSSRKKRDAYTEINENKSDGDYENDARLYHFYKYIEELLTGFGYNGNSCVKRTLCQLGAEPLHSDDDEDLLHELASFVLNSFIFLIENGQVTTNERQRRYLLFTTGTQWGVFVTVSIPLEPGSTVSVAWFFEANYYNVDNATYFDPLLGDIDTVSRNRDERSIGEPLGDLTRSKMYALIESMLVKHGHPGRSCLLRAVCENANSHFLHNGLLGDLLHLILTPSLSMSEEEVQDCFYEAEYNGIDNKCEDYFQDCPTSPLETISMCIDDFI